MCDCHLPTATCLTSGVERYHYVAALNNGLDNRWICRSTWSKGLGNVRSDSPPIGTISINQRNLRLHDIVLPFELPETQLGTFWKIEKKMGAIFGCAQGDLNWGQDQLKNFYRVKWKSHEVEKNQWLMWNSISRKGDKSFIP